MICTSPGCFTVGMRGIEGNSSRLDTGGCK